jgi:hypothetical protein
MKRFKFLRNQIEDQTIPEDYASWMWDHDGVVNPELNYELITDHFTGILEFLGYFPEHHIVIIHSIVGLVSGISHTWEDDNTGWGFDIREDLLEITWYRFHEEDELEMD